MSLFETHALQLVTQVEDTAVVEWHVVSITSKHNQLVLEDHSCVTVASCRPFAFDVMNLSFTLSAEHW